MRIEEFEAYLRELGKSVETIKGQDNIEYVLVHDVDITCGGLKGRRCDVAIPRSTAAPYVAPTAIHTRPALVPMFWSDPLKTQPSSIGPGWQYWSRRFDKPLTVKNLWTHILTVLSDPKWTPG